MFYNKKHRYLINPISSTRHTTNIRSSSNVNYISNINPVISTKSTTNINPVSSTRPSSITRPTTSTRFTSITRPVSRIRPIKNIRLTSNIKPITNINNEIKYINKPINLNFKNPITFEQIKNKNILDFIYKYFDIERKNKITNIYENDYIYIESEHPKDKENEKIKIFSTVYFYKETPRWREYIHGIKLNIDRLYEYDIFNEYYFYLYIDLSVIFEFNNEEIYNLFKEILNKDRVLIQFYYGIDNLIYNTDKNKYEHNNHYGCIIRYIPYVFYDKISECHCKDLDVNFITGFEFYRIQTFLKTNKNIYLLYNLNKPSYINIEYNINYFLGCCLGFVNKDDNACIDIFKNIIKQYVCKEKIKLITNKYLNYNIGYDEILLAEYDQRLNDKKLNDYYYNNNKYFYPVKNYSNELFIKTNIYKYNNNKIIQCSETVKYNIILWILLYMYNKEYFDTDKWLLNDFKYYCNKLNINIDDINNLINDISTSQVYKTYYQQLHFDSFDTFINKCIENRYTIMFHIERYLEQGVNIKLKIKIQLQIKAYNNLKTTNQFQSKVYNNLKIINQLQTKIYNNKYNQYQHLISRYNYKIINYIHKGAWCQSFYGIDKNNNYVCIKFCKKKNRKLQIGGLTQELMSKITMTDNEYEIIQKLEQYNITPKIYEKIKLKDQDIIISEYYGVNVHQLLNTGYNIHRLSDNKLRKSFNDKLIIILTYGIINILKYIHLSGILYIDLHLGNFLLDCPINVLTIENITNYLKIIDFGLSEILTEERLQEKEQKKVFNVSEIEVARFLVSDKIFQGYSPWFKDDIITLIINMIFLKLGYLPYSIRERRTKEYNILELLKISKLPDVFINIFNETEKIKSNKPLDYDKLLTLLKNYYYNNNLDNISININDNFLLLKNKITNPIKSLDKNINLSKINRRLNNPDEINKLSRLNKFKNLNYNNYNKLSILNKNNKI